MAQPKGTRINGVMFASVLIITILILRLAFLQVIQGEHHAALARRNTERKVINPAPRGLILDSAGSIIARNEYRYEVGLQIRPGNNWEDTFEFLAEFFQWEDEPRTDESLSLKQRRYNTVKQHRRYQETVILEQGMTREQMLKLEEIRWQYPMIEVIQRPVRHYDEGALFPQLVLGMNNDGTPRNNSLEIAWNDYLQGQDGHELWAVNVRSVPIELMDIQESIPGNNIVLTINAEFQNYVQKALAEGIENNQLNQINRGLHPPGRHGAAIVIDVRTGDILAMASYPSYDVANMYTSALANELAEIDNQLNKHLRFGNRKPPETSRDIFRPLWVNAGPGSTIKVLTSIMGLQEGVITPNQRYNDTGSYTSRIEGGVKINNANNRVWGSVNLREALTVSLNSYFGWMSDNVSNSGPRENRAIIRRYTDLFGLTGDTGFVDVPGQNRVGKVFETGSQSVLHYTIGADSAIAVSPMHMANLVSMVANKGYHFRPRLVKQVVDLDGNIIEEFEPEIYRSIPYDVVSEQTYNTVIDAMKSVTKYGSRVNGTSAAAFHDFPIEVAAKTGSANAQTGDAHSWWMGFAPANEPEIAVVVFTEHGGMNSHTHHIARSIFNEYFGLNATKEADLEDEQEEVEDTEEDTEDN